MAKTLEVSHITPFTDSSELCHSLTFLDTFWFKFPPVERLFFYSLVEPKEMLLTSVVPKLKQSLSTTLRHFLPLAGTLTWPHDSPKPVLLYRPPNGSVSLTVAESYADLDLLCTDEPREEASFRTLVPKLDVSETGASVISLQITLFPEKGFCIGVTTHHAVLDGKSTTMFVKSWAHFSRDDVSPLPPELTPFFERSVVRDPRGLDMLYLKRWLSFSKHPIPREDPKLFEVVKFPWNQTLPDSVRATFELSAADIANLRRKISSDSLRLSSFVVAFSYTVFCILNATKDEDGHVAFGFAADYRSRLEPPVPENYFGNCVGLVSAVEDAEEMRSDLSTVAAKVSGLVRSLERDDVTEGAEEWMNEMGSTRIVRAIGVAGSPRFRDYGVDFGWGRPRKLEIVSGTVTMAESKDGSGGIEVGVALKKHQMESFTSLFIERLKGN